MITMKLIYYLEIRKGKSSCPKALQLKIKNNMKLTRLLLALSSLYAAPTPITEASEVKVGTIAAAGVLAGGAIASLVFRNVPAQQAITKAGKSAFLSKSVKAGTSSTSQKTAKEGTVKAPMIDKVPLVVQINPRNQLLQTVHVEMPGAATSVEVFKWK